MQGLFFLDPDKVTDPILQAHAVPGIRLLQQIAQQKNLSVAQLAIAFMRDQPGVSSLVLGADAPEQVNENLACFDTPRLDDATMSVLQRAFSHVDIPAIMQVLSHPKK